MSMKKRLVVISLLALSLAAANTAMAKPQKWDDHPKFSQTFDDDDNDDDDGNNHDYDDDKKTGLENALDHVKNPKAREAIMRALEKHKHKHKHKHKGKYKEVRPEIKIDEQIVAFDRAMLRVGFNGTDSAASVTQALTLATKGKFGSTITWTSSNTAVISNDGKTVVRPTTADVKVILTATITKNAASATKQFEVTVKGQAQTLTDVQIVAADKAALTIGFNGTDNAAGVTQALNLATKGQFGSTITWTSSNTAVISNDGKTVVRPTAADVKVILTAVITKNAVSAAKQFEVTVKQQLTDQQIVAADKTALTIGFTGSDSASSVTSPLTLPAKGAYGSNITWTSSAPAIISNDGKTVVRPAIGQGDVTVTLIATIRSNNITDVKLFTLVVKQQFNDAEKVAADKAALAIGFSTGDSANNVTSKLTLPAAGAYGSTITWVSSNPGVISNDGKTVNRPAVGQGDTTVTFIATIKSNDAADVKTFTLVVKEQFTDAQKVAADKAALNIGFSGTDTAASVTSKLSLPAAGVNGSTIVWYSSNTTVIRDDGTVIRPAAGTGDKQVTLNAIIIGQTMVDTKTFTVTVKQLP